MPNTERRLFAGVAMFTVISLVMLADYPRTHNMFGKRSKPTRRYQTFAEVHYQRSDYQIKSEFVPAQYNSTFLSKNISIYTHCSIEKLHWLLNMTANWAGPISVAILTLYNEYILVQKYIDHLRNCSKAIDQQVSFHLVLPTASKVVPMVNEEVIHRIHMADDFDPCNGHGDTFSNQMKEQSPSAAYYKANFPYPYSLLRNVAKEGCKTTLVYGLDIDMIPPKKYNPQLETFFALNEPCVKCAYVLPTFELPNPALAMPNNKRELVHHFNLGKAQGYHSDYKHLQLSTDIPRWLKSQETSQEKLLYEVKYRYMYEPTYITLAKTMPPFDERFVGRGWDRVSHTYELSIAGFRFFVLNNGFTVHHGLPSQNMSEAETKQLRENSQRQFNFHWEVNAWYAMLRAG